MINDAKGGRDSLPLPMDLDLSPVSRWPTRLSAATVAAVVAAPLPSRAGSREQGAGNRDEGGLCAPRSPLPALTSRTSIIVVSYDNLVFNRLCLESLLYTTQDAQCEIVVVDNCSTDGTAEYLQQLAARNPQVRPMFNDCNAGFAAGSNQGLAAARGDYLVLLNNDTIVPPGWLEGLLAHLGDPGVGLVGPVTNRAGNEAQIDAQYRTYGEFLVFAAGSAAGCHGQQSELRVATMFCAAMRRAVFEEIGPLDERFEIGLFEDDDYSMRVRAAGYRVVCAEDVFVHHFGQASIGKLALAGRYGELFHANRRRWEEKWRRTWEPYRMRPSADYDAAVARIRQRAMELLPPGARLLVVSKGDETLLDLPGIRAEHFPQDAGGGYCGYNPADGAAAVRMLNGLRGGGAQYLLIPAASLWWLEFYGEFRRYLEEPPAICVHQDDDCRIYKLAAAEQE